MNDKGGKSNTNTIKDKLPCDPGARPNRDQKGTDGHLKSQVVKRSLVVGGHKTSVSLEDAFWMELRAIAQKLGVHLSQLVGSIDSEREHSNLSSAIRLFVFEYRSHPNPAELSTTAQAVLEGIRRLVLMH
jgi:predicted DNA-binding ribbon-helix-helix protein